VTISDIRCTCFPFY